MKRPDKRVERNTQSVIFLKNMLKEVCQNPSDYVNDLYLTKSLKSQGAITKYANEEKGIYGSSLNTVKRISDECIEGGFQALDKLRSTAYDAIIQNKERANDSNKTTKVGLVKRVNELEQELLLLRKINYSLLQGIARASNALQSISQVSDEKARNIKTKQTLMALASQVSLNPPPFNEITKEDNTNIVQLNPKANR
jgi:hypothetical protein